MAITSQKSDDGKNLVINVHDRFDFSKHKEFRDAYSAEKAAGITYVVDLSQTEYMDSAALGMLLVLKEFADEHNGNVVLQHPSDNIMKILNVANFDALFRINS